MKVLKILLVVWLAVYSSTSSAQYKYSISLGSNHERLHGSYGNHIRLYYNFSNNLRLHTEFARYMDATEKTINESFSYHYRQLNINVTYSLLFGDHLGIYAILGFDYLFGRIVSETNGIVNERFKESGGMNAGFGASYIVGHFVPYIESRSILSGSSSYLLFTAGLAYSFGRQEN